jgi:hypothetical protein
MGWTIDSAFEDDLLHDVVRDGDSFRFRVGELRTTIRVRLLRRKRTPGVWFEQSHAIHVPGNSTPYRTSRPWGDDDGYALHMAIRTITQDYRLAVHAEQHKPEESWLVPY